MHGRINKVMLWWRVQLASQGPRNAAVQWIPNAHQYGLDVPLSAMFSGLVNFRSGSD
jgi:hypothetical protein